jgi:DNA modification methylase
VAAKNERNAILCELNPDYCKMAKERILSGMNQRIDGKYEQIELIGSGCSVEIC